MDCAFRIVSLDLQPFEALFALNDAQLHRRGIQRQIVDQTPGFPCRVSLEDASVGEKVLLLHHCHHDVQGAYRASGAIFVREQASRAVLQVGEVPPVVRSRLISLRSYDKNGSMIDAALTPGAEIETTIAQLFANAASAYLHLHNAKRGCFSCAVHRA